MPLISELFAREVEQSSQAAASSTAASPQESGRLSRKLEVQLDIVAVGEEKPRVWRSRTTTASQLCNWLASDAWEILVIAQIWKFDDTDTTWRTTSEDGTPAYGSPSLVVQRGWLLVRFSGGRTQRLALPCPFAVAVAGLVLGRGGSGGGVAGSYC